MKCVNFHRRTEAQAKPNRVAETLQLWRDVAVAVARAEAAKDKTAPTRWADETVAGYVDFLQRLRSRGLIE